MKSKRSVGRGNRGGSRVTEVVWCCLSDIRNRKGRAGEGEYLPKRTLYRHSKGVLGQVMLHEVDRGVFSTSVVSLFLKRWRARSPESVISDKTTECLGICDKKRSARRKG